jgi:hypothetical protein
MAMITPLNAVPIGLFEKSTLAPPAKLATSVISPADVRRWLTERNITSESTVVVQWNRDLAVETKWSVFCTYWDSFCYPSSDDVDVFPVLRGWLLQYHHWEEFEFSRAT